MSGKTKTLVASTLAFAFVAIGAGWFIRANSITANDACIRNLRQIGGAMQQASTTTNNPSAATDQTVPAP